MDSTRGAKDHTNTSISHQGFKANVREMPEIMSCRILVFMWSFGALPELSFVVPFGGSVP